MTAAFTVATTVGTAAYNSSQAKKAKKKNDATIQNASNAGAFAPLTIPKPSELEVPSADEILASWRNNVNTNFPEYDKIAGKLNVSEQDAARVANRAANPQYYPLLDQTSTNALQASRGVIPKDVQQNILRTANEDSYLRGFSYGTNGGGGNVFAGGNDAAANLALRNTALTSLDLMKYGDALSGAVLQQSRAGRGDIISAQETVPSAQIFQDQMNADAIAQYNFASDTQNYKAGVANAPIQAAYGKLALQMGVQGQNNALSAQTSAQNMQLAMSAMQALGKAYGGSSTIASNQTTTGIGGGQAGGVNAGQGGYLNTTYDYNSSYLGNPNVQVNQPVSTASTIRGTV